MVYESVDSDALSMNTLPFTYCRPSYHRSAIRTEPMSFRDRASSPITALDSQSEQRPDPNCRSEQHPRPERKSPALNASVAPPTIPGQVNGESEKKHQSLKHRGTKATKLKNNATPSDAQAPSLNQISCSSMSLACLPACPLACLLCAHTHVAKARGDGKVYA